MLRRFLKIFNLYTKTEYEELQDKLKIWRSGFVPPGHYYSPLNNVADLKKNESVYFEKNYQIKDIDLRLENQKGTLDTLHRYYDPSFFTEEKDYEHRYYLNNNFFSYSDGMFLFCLMKHIKPSKIIEVGSGFSSALMLDVNDKCFNASVQLTFIEPFPEERLNTLLKESDHKSSTVIKKMIQEVDLNFLKHCSLTIYFLLTLPIPLNSTAILTIFYLIFYLP